MIYPFHDAHDRRFPTGQAGNKHGQRRHDHADAGDGQLRLRVRDQQHHRQQEHTGARKKCRLVRNCRGRCGTSGRSAVFPLGAFELLAEAKRKIGKHEHKADGRDCTGIGNEIREGVAE